MPCDPFQIKDKDGNVVGGGFVCSRGRQKKPCKFCGRPSTKLCDRPLEGAKTGKTCDAAMCDRCATSVGSNTDLCPPHARERTKSIDEARAWLEAEKAKDELTVVDVVVRVGPGSSEHVQRELELVAQAHATPISEKVAYVKSQGQTRNHGCHWPGCKKQVPPALWGCKEHWGLLPQNLKNRIWQAYRPGQEKTLTPSREYLQVAHEVDQWIRSRFGEASAHEPEGASAYERAVRRAREREEARKR